MTPVTMSLSQAASGLGMKHTAVVLSRSTRLMGKTRRKKRHEAPVPETQLLRGEEVSELGTELVAQPSAAPDCLLPDSSPVLRESPLVF